MQTGGTVSVAQDLYLSEGSTTTGLYELSGGDVSSSRFLVGLHGEGQMDHTGGTLTVRGSRYDLTLGWYTDGYGVYNLSGATSQIIVEGASGLLRVGFSGTGVFNQSDGSVVVDNRVELGGDSTSDGVYNLSGGSLLALRMNVGSGGTGLFNQTGGNVTVTGSSDSDVIIGNAAGSNGSYQFGGATAQLDIADDLVVGNSGTGMFHQTDGHVTVTDHIYVGLGSGSSGAMELDGGALGSRIATIGLTGAGAYRQSGGELVVSETTYVGYNAGVQGFVELHGGDFTTTDLMLGQSGVGVLEQDGGDLIVADDFYLGTNANGAGAYYLDGGNVSARRILVGVFGDSTMVQTGGNVSVRTGSSPTLVVGYYAVSTSSYEIRGGTVSASMFYNGLAPWNEQHGGVGLTRVVGNAATINVDGYYQNALSTLEMQVGNGGVSPIQVSGTATLITGTQLNMGLAGGVALLTDRGFDLLTAGNVSGAFTLAESEPLWNVSQSGTLVQAELAGAGLGPVTADYDTFVELEVEAGNGATAGYASLLELEPGRTFWALLDVVQDGEALTGVALEELADYIRSAGHSVYTTHPILDSGCKVTESYNLMLDLDVLAETSYFAWDFAEYDSTLRVAHVALGVPEPSAWILALLAMSCLLCRRRALW